MRRSGHLNGATVALELLPSEIDAGATVCLVAEICTSDRDATGGVTGAEVQIADYCLKRNNVSLPLGSIASLAKLPSGPTDLAKPVEDELASGNLAAALGKLLLALVERGGADAVTLYRISVVLARLARSREAFAILSLIEGPAIEHPAISALRGYLALQNGEVETGRRFLAKAALSTRGVPAHRNVLHFTQHVLLLHQFNG